MKESPPEEPEVSAADEATQAADLKRKASFGAVMLALRTVLVQLIVLGGNVYLYRLLEPSDFGVFAIVQFALAFFAFFGDAGLGASLIQKKEEPSQLELSSIWYLQIALSLIIAAAVSLGAPYLIRFWPDLPPSTALLLQALSLTLLLTALRVIPAILMERHLQFGRLAVLEVLLSVGFYVTAVLCALLGWRVKALVAAVLAQGVLGLVGVFVMRPWRPGLHFGWAAIKPLVRFGVFFQSKNVLGFVSSAVLPGYGGRALGQRSVGLLSWAQTTAFFPLQIVAIISRITFPLYSRMQSNRALLAETLDQSVQLTTVTTLGFVSVFLGIGPNLIEVVFTAKWMPAIYLLYIYALGISIGFFTPLAATALDATGRAAVTLKVSLLSTVLIWIVVPIGAYLYGMTGFAAGYAIVMWIGNVVMLFVIKSVFPESRFYRRVRAPIVATVATTVVGYFVVRPFAHSVVTLILGMLVLLIAYGGIIMLIDRRAIMEAIATMRRKDDAGSEASSEQT